MFEEEIDEKLLVNKERIVEKIKNGEEITSIRPIIKVHLLDRKRKPTLDVKSTFLYDPQEEDVEFFRELKSIETIDGKSYKITVRKIILEPHDYINNTGLAIIVIWVVLITGFFFINWKLSSRIWQPFKNNLDTLKKYKVGLDEALQHSKLTENQANSINAALTASKRLAKLNQTLLFLTKIENKQFTKENVCELNIEIEKTLNQMQDFVKAQISLVTNLLPTKKSKSIIFF